MLKKLREPVNSLTHWVGAFLALNRPGCIINRRLGNPYEGSFIRCLWRQPDPFVFGQRHLSYGAGKRPSSGNLSQD